MYKNKIEKAKELAAEKHKDQSYGKGPYTDHLNHVYSVLIRFGYNPAIEDNREHQKLSEDLTIAAYLHDIVEDTDVSLEDLKKIFGKRVAKLVDGVTNEPGKNRKERHRKTYPKTKRISGAMILKLADRIANVESCRASNNGLIRMYQKEWESFQKELRNGEHEKMWRYLERLVKE